MSNEITLPQSLKINEELVPLIKEPPTKDVENPSNQWCKLVGVKVLSKEGWQGSSPEETLTKWADEMINIDSFISKLLLSKAEVSKPFASLVSKAYSPIQQEEKKQEQEKKEKENILEKEANEILENVEGLNKKFEKWSTQELTKFKNKTFDDMNKNGDSHYNLKIGQYFPINGIIYQLMFRSANLVVGRDNEGKEIYPQPSNSAYEFLWELQPLNLSKQEIIDEIGAKGFQRPETLGLKFKQGDKGDEYLVYCIEGKYTDILGPLPFYKGEEE
jgi:hypothetical protein